MEETRPADRRPQLRPAARRLAAAGRARAHRRARRPRAPARPRRQAPAADPHARRARAGDGARGEPHDRRRRLRGAARAGCCTAGAARAAGPSSTRARRSRLGTPFSPQRHRRRAIDLAHAALAAPIPECARRRRWPSATWTPSSAGTATTCSAARSCAPRSPTGSPRAACRPGGPGAGHLRGAARVRARARGAGHARRPGARRAPDLPERARRRARPRRPVVPVPMDPDPAGTGRRGTWTCVTAAVRDAAPRLTYLIPDLQNPTGGVLDAAGRERLVALARRTGTPLLIDETLAELALDGPPPRHRSPSHGGADSTHVITVGSAARCSGAGCASAGSAPSPPLVRRLGARCARRRPRRPGLEQLVAARLLADLDPVVADRRVELAAARDAPARPARRRSSRRWRASRPTGGLTCGSSWARRSPAGSRCRPAGTRSCSPRARASGWTGRSSATCGCPTPCAATGPRRRSNGCDAWTPSTSPTGDRARRRRLTRTSPADPGCASTPGCARRTSGPRCTSEAQRVPRT